MSYYVVRMDPTRSLCRKGVDMIDEYEYNEKEDARCKYVQGKPRNLTVDQMFRLILKRLRIDFPAQYPVKVRRHLKEILKRGGHKDAPFGWCSIVNEHKSRTERYFLIEINRSVPWHSQFETILHEWAHALTWEEVVSGRDHSDIFHRKYGVLYRAYVED